MVDHTLNKIKNMSDDRVLVLEPIDGKPLTTGGLIDKRLFTGDNRLHSIRDTRTGFWYLKYDMGTIPQPLQQRFTTFQKMYSFTDNYFNNRNIRIKEIIDVDA